MDDNLIVFILIILFGDKFIKFIIDNDRSISLPFLLIYFILFAVIFHVGLPFFVLVFLIKGFHIPWMPLCIVSMLISFFSALVLLLIDRNRGQNGAT